MLTVLAPLTTPSAGVVTNKQTNKRTQNKRQKWPLTLVPVNGSVEQQKHKIILSTALELPCLKKSLNKYTKSGINKTMLKKM